MRAAVGIRLKPAGLRWQLTLGYAALVIAVTGLLTGLAVRTSVSLSFATERQRSLAAVSAAAAMFLSDVTSPNADPQSAASQLGAAAGGRLLWVGPDGHVRVDGAGPTAAVGTEVNLPARLSHVTAPQVGFYTVGGTWTAFAAAPLSVSTRSGPPDGELLLIRDLTPLRQELGVLRIRLWLLGGLLALLGLGAGLALANSLARPIEKVTQAARRMQAGELRQSVDVTGRGEVAALAAAFNDMAAQVASLDEQRRSFVADAAHELRTPLASLHALAEALLADPTTPQETLAGITRQTERLGRLVDNLLTLAQLDNPEIILQRQVLQVRDVVQEAVWVAEPLARERGVRFDTAAVDSEAYVQGDPDWLHRALVNLMDNAVRHSPDGGVVRLSSQVGDGSVHLVVDDQGAGIPAEMLSRLGTRFFRTDPARGRDTGGTGLGLAIVAQVMRLHGGRVRFGPSRGGGLRVTLELPAASPGGDAS